MNINNIIRQIAHGLRKCTDGRILFVDLSTTNKVVEIFANNLETINQIPIGETSFLPLISGNH
jgi:hypothetical protein